MGGMTFGGGLRAESRSGIAFGGGNGTGRIEPRAA
jgi:hypothetical protein